MTSRNADFLKLHNFVSIDFQSEKKLERSSRIVSNVNKQKKLKTYIIMKKSQKDYNIFFYRFSIGENRRDPTGS